MKSRKISGRGYAILYFAILFFSGVNVYAQTTSLLADGADDYIRRSQLLGRIDLASGLSNRSFSGNMLALDSLLHWPGKSAETSAKSSFRINYLPLSFSGQYNSHHPYGWNTGSMIPNNGVEGLISGGLSLETGHFSIQLKPELVYAQNSKFETFPTDHYTAIWTQYYQWLNTTDIPERFGEKTYKHFYPGQSSIRYTVKDISLGISTENIWWGPGTRNALVMSNNAPGFVHFTFNTVRPVKTKIGSFEWQLIAGLLSSSGQTPPETNRYGSNGNLLYAPKKEETRYLSGMVLTWQPKWTKGLYVGFTKAAYLYKSDLSGIADIFPLQGVIKSNAERNGRKAALGSLFLRYVMPNEKAELYVEYGRNDKSPTLINLVSDQGYPRAYVAGFKKLFATKRNAHLQFSSEFTQMQLPTADLIKQAASWYTNPYVRQGYTHNGRVIGSGIGPGSNSQMADISWVKGFTKVGILFERLVHNNDFYYNTFTASNDYTRHWVDLSTAVHLDWMVKQFLISSQISLIRSLNYQWYILPGLGYFKNGYDVLNFQGFLSVSYKL